MKRRAAFAAVAAAAITAIFTGGANAEAHISESGMILGDLTLGNPDADVKVIEYASFTCPHCRDFHEEAWPELKADYIDTGKISFTYREVYFDRFGLWAGMLARCGGEERYFGIAELIYDTQRSWIGDQTDSTVADNLRKLGRQAGLTNDEINACLNDGDAARTLVAAYQENAEADGVRGTPSFVIDGELFGGPWKELIGELDRVLSD